VTSPPYWGLRDYGVDGQIGMEPTLGEHLSVMVEVFDLVRRAMKPEATLWLNYGDCYATKPNGRSARKRRRRRATTIAPSATSRSARSGRSTATLIANTKRRRAPERRRTWATLGAQSGPRVVGGGMLKPKDLCMIPNRLAIALQDAGWWVRSEIVWGKPNPMPDSSGRYRPSTAHEKIWLLSKSAKCFYDSEAVRMPAAESVNRRWSQDVEGQLGSDRANAGGKTNGAMKAVGGQRQAVHWREPQGLRRPSESIGHQAAHRRGQDVGAHSRRPLAPQLRAGPVADHPPEVWEIATAAFSEAHFATFPPALVTPCILAGCPEGGTVLDPFFGAGTTGLVADRLGRNCIGIELNPEYAEIARRRLLNDCGLFAEIEVIHTGPATRAA
jgi:DNA modification methylase